MKAPIDGGPPVVVVAHLNDAWDSRHRRGEHLLLDDRNQGKTTTATAPSRKCRTAAARPRSSPVNNAGRRGWQSTRRTFISRPRQSESRPCNTTIPDIDEEIPDAYNSGQSQATSLTAETNYLANLGVEASPLRSALATIARQPLSSSLTPDHIVSRVQALSCAGCHRFSNGADLGGGITWPASLGFTHVTERETEVVDGVTRYVLSEALLGLLAAPKGRLREVPFEVAHLAAPAARPIGGFCVH